MQNYSFQKGLSKVPFGEVPLVKTEIMQALGIKSHPAWLARLRGQVVPKVTEIEAIEQVFQKHKIKDIWGE